MWWRSGWTYPDSEYPISASSRLERSDLRKYAASESRLEILTFR
jgi:hypothetical protein